MTVDKEFHVEVTSTSHCVTPYIDDLVIYSETLEGHMRDLERVFKCLSEEQYAHKSLKHFPFPTAFTEIVRFSKDVRVCFSLNICIESLWKEIRPTGIHVYLPPQICIQKSRE